MNLFLKNLLADVVHLFYPHHCLHCHTDVLEHKQYICGRCFSELPTTPFSSQAEHLLTQLFIGRMPVKAATAAFFYGKHTILQTLIAELKYRGNPSVGLYLGQLLGQQLAQSIYFEDVEALVPLPLHSKKQRYRGFNQAEAICQGIASVWQKPIYTSVVKRTHHTLSQTKKDRTHRLLDTEKLFVLDETAILQHKHVLLVDDIITTGATIEACGNTLLTIEGLRLSLAAVGFSLK